MATDGLFDFLAPAREALAIGYSDQTARCDCGEILPPGNRLTGILSGYPCCVKCAGDDPVLEMWKQVQELE